MELKIYRYTYNNILAMTVQARYDLVIDKKAITSTEATLNSAMIDQFDVKAIEHFIRLIEERYKTIELLLRTCHEYVEPRTPFFQNVKVIYKENLSNTYWKQLDINKRLKQIEKDFE